MLYRFGFSLLSLALFAAAWLFGGWGWLLVWPAVSFLLVTAGYFGLGPRIFGKRPNGRLAWWSLLLLWPQLVGTWSIWHTLRLFSKEDCCNEFAPGLWIGRRPLKSDLPSAVDLVIDLTAEFRAIPAIASGRAYLCVPILDTLAPSEQQLQHILEFAANWPGVVYIHCAQGHGRSALVAAALLLRKGLATDAQHAVALLQQVRPKVELQFAQRRFLRRWVETRRPVLSAGAS